MRCIRNNKGSATIMIILISGVILTVGLGFNWLVREHLKSAEGLKNKAEAILKARSAYDTLIYLMLNGKPTQKEMILSGGREGMTMLTTIPLNGKEVSLTDDVFIKVQDSNGLLSLVTVDMPAVERLIKKAGRLDDAAIPIESLQDWIDPDDFSRVNGAEKLYYHSQQALYEPRNYALQYKDELSFIRGIGPDLYGKIKPYLTMLPSTGFNPNTAGDEVLTATLGLNDESLKTLKDFMAKSPVSSQATLFFLTGHRLREQFEEIHFYPSRFMDITVTIGSPRSLYTINGGLNFVNNPNSPYSVLYWHEE